MIGQQVKKISVSLLSKTIPVFLQKKLGPLCYQIRNLNVHEHISYTLLREYGIPVPNFGVATTKDEAKKIAQGLKTNDLVVKAQVLTGGRGKGTFKNGYKGGVQLVKSPDEVAAAAEKMLGQLLVTKQTGAAGRICNKVMVTERKYQKKEYYIAVMMERSFNGPVIIASSEGGVEIEEVAAKNPGAIMYEPIDYAKGLQKSQAEKVIKKLGLEKQMDSTLKLLDNMYKLFKEKDALLIEINPYAEDKEGKYYALDAKFNFDDTAFYRQKDLFSKRDWSQEDMREVQAAKYDLNYIALDGSIGCMVNGAGLAMATMDIITLHGGVPANFLDVGGGATKEAVTEAFKIITTDPKVKCIYVNIFGGIMRCDIIAEGIVAAMKELKMSQPIVCRLQGTNAEAASKIISQSGLKIEAENDLDKAAKSAVSKAK
ncbi:succinate--CoA ligase [ADP-forming] subunit beta, mitochondrial-like [Agrilus planipennis]|uniref:Succinate--CoA ligase [ADP-forming] subunit beta, mitochondrial n=1 Tax=Agrilus planipennis TaxID=224129 RepID=A0A1W4XMD1_AGRPL|nr:succinate--CoA ligase [ADP-forming] subunit beta, mitochondrial-like [Agrilus planipennis]